MVRPQNSPSWQDAPEPPGVASAGSHPPVPIVEDGPCLNKHCHRTNRQEQFQSVDECYDVGVGKLISARSGREFVRHVVPAVLKPARTLWNEVIGFLFICFAVIFGFKAVRTYMDLADAPAGQETAHLVRLLMAGFCTLLMLYFGISSFLRARKISRS